MTFTKKILGSPGVNQHIAEITGKKSHTRPFVWTRGNETYSHISGAMVLPTFSQKGYLITMGVTPDGNILHCIDEFESKDPYQIIKKAQYIQESYGPEVIKNWWGDPTELMSLVNEINIEGNPVLISQPIDFDMSDSFALYVSRIVASLSPTYKTLWINKCNIFENHIRAFVADKTAKADNNPAIAITGALIHTLLIMRPWEQSVVTNQLIPTSFEDFAMYDQEQAMKDIERELYA